MPCNTPALSSLSQKMREGVGSDVREVFAQDQMKQIYYFNKEEMISCVQCHGEEGWNYLKISCLYDWEHNVAFIVLWGSERRSLGHKLMN